MILETFLSKAACNKLRVQVPAAIESALFKGGKQYAPVI
jgi:hypothetical protein